MKRASIQIMSSDIEAIAKATAKILYDMEDKVLTVAQMAQKLGKSEEAIKKMVQRNQLPYHRTGKTIYFSDKETTKYLLHNH